MGAYSADETKWGEEGGARRDGFGGARAGGLGCGWLRCEAEEDVGADDEEDGARDDLGCPGGRGWRGGGGGGEGGGEVGGGERSSWKAGEARGRREKLVERGRTIQAMDGHERPWTAMKGHERARKGTEGNGRPRSSVEIAYLVAREESSDEPRSAPRTPDGVSRRRVASSMLPHCRWEKVGEGVRRCEKVKEGERRCETV